MITQLKHQDPEIADKIYGVFQASYAIEAQLLGVPLSNFPPLGRKISDLQESKTLFVGFWKGSDLAGVIEIEEHKATIDICSLIVAPNYFRQGIARELLHFAKKAFNPSRITVETGLLNQPAIRLYEQFGFKAQERWMTSIGIEKIKFLFKKE